MKNRLTQALRGEINQKTADYIDAGFEEVRNNLIAEIILLQKRIKNLEAKQAENERIIERLQQPPPGDSDDKYALTRRKLIQLMKELGIE